MNQPADVPAHPPNSRRVILLGSLSVVVAGACPKSRGQPGGIQPDRRWYEAALQMKRLAQSWGDQPYGAVLVLGGEIVGHGPSRVVKNNDASGHAEREAIRDARKNLGRERLTGAGLYSTSRPCSVCEAAAAEAGVARMFFGPSLVDAGKPGSGGAR